MAQPLWRKLTFAIAGTLLVAICAHIQVPLFYTPVPITLQTFAVLFLGLAMGPQWAFASLVLYLLEGAAGLPVFNPNGPGGMVQLAGPTGGYLLSYPFAAALTGLLYRFGKSSFPKAAWSAALGSLLVLMGGSLWLAALTHAGLKTVVAQAIVPFLPGDILKVCAAAAAVTVLQAFRSRHEQASLDEEL